MKIKLNVEADAIKSNHKHPMVRGSKAKTIVKADAKRKTGDNCDQTTAHGLKVKTNFKSGGWMNHNQRPAHGLKVKTNFKSGSWMNHNQTSARGLKVNA